MLFADPETGMQEVRELRIKPPLAVTRNFGDQQAPLATRTSGLGQSARSLIYADGVLLSTLIGNNNSGASPRWALVAPEEIERIDVMYGPFSAAYAGNSMGAVVEVITRMPEKFEAGAKAQGALQNYSLYGTSNTYSSGQFSAILGKRTPNIPRLKVSGLATYRYNERLSGSLGARYSDHVYATIDNTDINPNTYQGFDSYFVMDARVRYQVHKQWSAALGVDNLNNRKYFLFHPFPQRTAVAELKFTY